MADPETIESVLGTSWIASRIARYSETQRAAVEAIGARALDVASIARCFEAVRGEDKDILRLLANAIARDAPEEMLGALLPHSQFADDVDVRLRWVYEAGTDWHGDLVLAPCPTGTKVIVGTARGAAALAALDRDVRAPIADLSTVGLAASDPGVARELAATSLPGVRALSIPQMSGPSAAAVVLQCPALEQYGGPMTADVADAIATTAMKRLSLGTADDEILGRLARSAHLEHLTLDSCPDLSRVTTNGFAQLAALAPLRILHVNHCKLEDAHVRGIGELVQLEALMAANNPFGDAGGAFLGKLAKLAALDAHDTQIGDATLAALAKLPRLEALDIVHAPVTPDGIMALASCAALAHLGLAWDCPRELDEAAAKLVGVSVVQNDYMFDLGALWVRTEFDMLWG